MMGEVSMTQRERRLIKIYKIIWAAIFSRNAKFHLYLNDKTLCLYLIVL